MSVAQALHKLQLKRGSMPPSNGCAEYLCVQEQSMSRELVRFVMPCVACPRDRVTLAWVRDQRSANEAIPRQDTYRRRKPAFPDYTARWRCRSRSPALARATRGTWRRRGVTSTGPRGTEAPAEQPRREQLPALQTPDHLGSTDTGARREERAATAPTRRETPKGCHRADADPGQPHAAAARRGTQQAA